MTDLAERCSANFRSLRQSPATHFAPADSPQPVQQWSLGLASLRISRHRERRSERRHSRFGARMEFCLERKTRPPLLPPE